MSDYTPRERAIIALERRPPVPGLVPTFELEFQLTDELMGKEFHRGVETWAPAGATQRASEASSPALSSPLRWYARKSSTT